MPGSQEEGSVQVERYEVLAGPNGQTYLHPALLSVRMRGRHSGAAQRCSAEETGQIRFLPLFPKCREEEEAAAAASDAEAISSSSPWEEQQEEEVEAGTGGRTESRSRSRQDRQTYRHTDIQTDRLQSVPRL